MTIPSAIFLLFLVMDPLGNIPLFLSALKNIDRSRRNKIVMRELTIALGVLVFFLIFGRLLLNMLQLSEPSLSISGGIILFLIALRMIFPARESLFGDNPGGEPFIVPLAIPLIAGPSALTTVLLLATREPNRYIDWLIALACAWLLATIILLLSNGLSRFLGKRGLIALERLMGMLLTIIAVQMFLTGISQFMAH
ncbi:MAG: MarC family protein [Planctomycetota bacterium]